MKLVFLTRHNPYGTASHGGAESSSRLIAEHLARRGHQVTYLAERVAAPERAVAQQAGVELRRFARRAEDGNRLAQWFARTLNDWLIRWCLRDREVDLVYCFYEASALKTALALRQQRPDVKIVMRMAGLHWYERARRNPKNAERFIHWFNAVDSVNFIAEPLVAMTNQKLAELGMKVAFQHHFVLDIGSSVAVGRRTAYETLPPTPFRIVMAARFSTYQKRQDILIRAAALLPEDVAVQITFIGDGVTRPELQRLAAELGVADRVTFSPFQSQPALWAQLQEAHLLCHSVDYEGLGKIVIESMASGLPVLASEVEPLRSYIIDGENGFLVRNDPAAWAAKIGRLIEGRGARARVSAAAMAYVRRHYDPTVTAAVYEERFAAIIQRGSAPDQR